MLYNIFKIGFDPADIKMIFHTHGHFDHFGATKLLVRLTGAKTLLGWRDAKMFREDSEFALCDYLEGIPTEMFVPDIEVHDGDIVRIGNTVVEAYETPGHSEGVITYRIHVTDGEEEKIALLCGGAGFNTLKREFIALFCNEGWRDDFEYSLKKWKELTQEQIRRIDADDIDFKNVESYVDFVIDGSKQPKTIAKTIKKYIDEAIN